MTRSSSQSLLLREPPQAEDASAAPQEFTASLAELRSAQSEAKYEDAGEVSQWTGCDTGAAPHQPRAGVQHDEVAVSAGGGAASAGVKGPLEEGKKVTDCVGHCVGHDWGNVYGWGYTQPIVYPSHEMFARGKNPFIPNGLVYVNMPSLHASPLYRPTCIVGRVLADPCIPPLPLLSLYSCCAKQANAIPVPPQKSLPVPSRPAKRPAGVSFK